MIQSTSFIGWSVIAAKAMSSTVSQKKTRMLISKILSLHTAVNLLKWSLKVPSQSWWHTSVMRQWRGYKLQMKTLCRSCE